MTLSLLINYFVSLFMICSPLTAIPVFLTLSRGRGLKERRQAAVTAGAAVAIILIISTWIGQPLLSFLSIRIASFQCGGGVVLFLLALSLLSAEVSPIRQKEDEVLRKPSFAIVPLAIPLMAGPGAISAAIVASSSYASVEAKVLLSICGLCLGVVTALLLLFSARIEKYLGNTGLNIISRIGGLILAALAVEIIFQGVEGFIHSFQ
jgi:multiple antibiotic resistance protein